MNLINPHQAIRQKDRRDNQKTDKTGRAAALICAGKSLGNVLRLVRGEDETANRRDGEPAKGRQMPGPGQGRNQGAQAVVDDYRREGLAEVGALAALLNQIHLNGIGDDQLNIIALACENTAQRLRRYLKAVEAGSAA